MYRTGSQSGPIVVQDTSTDLNDTSQTPPPSATYTLSVPANTVASEGSPTTVTLTTTNVGTGTAYWSIDSTHAGDFQISSGTFNITNYTDTVDLTPTADLTTEGTEVFTISVYDSNQPGATAKDSLQIPINDTSQAPTYSITPVSSSVNEGSTLRFDVATTGVANGTTLYWSINGVTSGGTGYAAADPTADFAADSGQIQIQSGAANFLVSVNADNVTEAVNGDEFNVQISTTQGGSAVVTSSTVVINDTSQTPPATYAIAGIVSTVNEGVSSV